MTPADRRPIGRSEMTAQPRRRTQSLSCVLLVATLLGGCATSIGDSGVPPFMKCDRNGEYEQRKACRS